MESLKKNLLCQLMYQVLIIALPMITTPYIARILGSDISGVYSYTNTIAQYFVIAGMLGLEQYGARCIARSSTDHNELDRVFSELIFLHILISVPVCIFYFLYVAVFTDSFRSIFYIQGLYVISACFDINWFFFGIEKFDLTVTRNVIIKVIAIIATFLFVKSQEDLGVYSFIMSFSVLLGQVAMWPIVCRYVSWRKVKIVSLNEHWVPLLILFVAVIAANLNRMVDKVMLGWIGAFSELGYYDYADKIIRIPLGGIAALGTVMLSRMSNVFAKKEKEVAENLLGISACLIIFLSVGMGFGIAATAPEFVAWYLGNEYMDVVVLLRILALSIPLVGWNNYIRTQVLIPLQKDMVYSKAVMVGAVVNVIINSVLISSMGAIGASMATVISYGVIFLIQTTSIGRTIKNVKEYVIVSLIAGLIMYGTVRVSADLLGFAFGVGALIGVLFYGCVFFGYLKYRHPELSSAILNSQ